MIPININNDSISYENTVPSDIEKLANNFWNSLTVKKDRYSIKRRNIKSIHLPADYQYYNGENDPKNRPEPNEEYLLLKIMQIKKIEGGELQAKNFGAWFSDNFANFVRNDSTNAILNTDGTIRYISEPQNAEIFAFKKSKFINIGGSSETTINAIFFKGDWENNQVINQNISHIYIFFELPLNFIQRILFRPLNNLVKVFFPKINFVGGPSSAGVRIPPRGGQ